MRLKICSPGIFYKLRSFESYIATDLDYAEAKEKGQKEMRKQAGEIYTYDIARSTLSPDRPLLPGGKRRKEITSRLSRLSIYLLSVLDAFVLAAQEHAQGIGLTAIPGRGMDVGADHGQRALLANLGGPFALQNLVYQLSIGHVPAAKTGLLCIPENLRVACLVVENVIVIKRDIVVHDDASNRDLIKALHNKALLS